MLFNSLHFLIFFPLVVCLYFALPRRHRWAFLLAASYYFYMAWRPAYAVLIAASTLVDYVASRAMGRTQRGGVRKALLLCSLATNLGLLFTFKYWEFFAVQVQRLGGLCNVFIELPRLDFLLPVGISFYTFQTLGYTIDVYRGRIEPERHLGKFALFVSFFPQLVAGPIERASALLPQLKAAPSFNYARLTRGLRMMLSGMIKKVVIADALAPLVDRVYGDPGAHSGPALLLATVYFAIQIYCDFSGYSEIAIGAAQVLGIRLMQNFDRPYLAASIPEFWSRWHISLSTWFRDYVFIPLGGSRVRTGRLCFNIMAVFMLSGLWHGARWSFVVWGMLHGAGYLAFRLSAPWRAALCHRLGLHLESPIRRACGWLTTIPLVCLAWVFFRARSLDEAFVVLRGLLTGWSAAAAAQSSFLQDLFPNVIVPLSFIAALMAWETLESQEGRLLNRARRHPATRWATALAGLAAVLLLGTFSGNTFIYFAF